MINKEFFNQRIKRGVVRRLNNRKIASVARDVARKSPTPSGSPIVFFKASTGIDDLSWNSGFHLLSSWALRLKGIPVAYFACRSGMSHCVLGTNRDDVGKPPPCASCVYQSKTLYAGVKNLESGVSSHSQGVPPQIQEQTLGLDGVYWFDFHRDTQLAAAIENLSLKDLMSFEWQGVPLGPLCLPGLRWILRIHHLNDDEQTRYLLQE